MAVLPALTVRTYADLEIQEGDTTSREFVRIHVSQAPEPERQRVWRQMEDCCGYDAEAMLWTMETLGGLAG